MSLRPILLCAAFLAGGALVSTQAAQESGASPAAMKAGLGYLRALESAGAAYAEHQYSVALDKLDLADQIRPDIPDTWNMRGAIYAEQHDFDKAEKAFEKASELNPGDFWPEYNLAELELMQRKYPEAAAAFQKLTVYHGHEELVAFKIIFANLLGGNPDAAKPVLDAMKFPADTPAYYFAQSAWAFAHKDRKHGNYWSDAGLKIFGLSACISFYDSLVQVGWLPPRGADGSAPTPSDFSSLPGPTPSLDVAPGAGGLQ